MVNIPSFVFRAFSEIDYGGVIVTASSGRNFAVNMKNVSRRKATSHIAVISSETLCRLALTFGITIFILNGEKNDKSK